MRLYWFLPVLQLRSALGAYVQWKQCNDSPQTTSWGAVSLDATLRRDEFATQMSLELVDSVSLPECETGGNIKNATVDLTLLGHSKTLTPAIDGPCAVGHSADANQSSTLWVPVLTLSQSLDDLYPLSTFQIAIHLIATNSSEIACISAYITPEIPRNIRNALCYGPLAVLIMVLVATYCRVLLNAQDVLNEDDESQQSEKPPSVVNGIGDCLQHLQFMFLTACLSIIYPGFFQPAVSALNWFCLFSSSNAFLKGYTYSGISDGIYEINGTYGGTFGMEHMIQNLGAPMTMEIWINMVILVLVALAGSAILILLHRFLYHRLYPSSAGQPFSTVQELIRDVLRMVLSYFMTPIVAISAYQFDHIGLLPTYLVSMAILLVVIILAAYVWLFRNTSTERLAALVINVPQAARANKPRRPNLRAFVLVHFALAFFRGIIIGALQISGKTQVALLMLCELVLMASIPKFIPDLVQSTMMYSAVGRLIAVSLMIALLVPSASISTKSFVAYLILALELMILVVAIFIPQMYTFVKFWVLRASLEKAPVYNMRQLRRRPHQQRQLPSRPLAGDHELICVNCGLDPTVRSDSSGSLRLDFAGIRSPSSRYVRPNTRTTPHSARSLSGAFRDISPHSLASSPMIEKRCQEDDMEDMSNYAESRGHRLTSRGSYASIASTEPIIPRDVDYSVREMDLYYREPRQKIFGEESSQPQEGSLAAKLEPLSRWWKKTFSPP